VVNLLINSNDTIVDHTWIWRADHGSASMDHQSQRQRPRGQRQHVTAYGLFVEHHQQYQVLWNGTPAAPTSTNPKFPTTHQTRPLYQRTRCERRAHQRLGILQSCQHSQQPRSLGPRIYSVFRSSQRCTDPRHRSPTVPGVRFHHMITIALDNLGGISNVIDNVGGPTSTKPRNTPKVTDFP